MAKEDRSAITGTIADTISEILAKDEERARAYLAESFLTAAMLALFHARRRAGLTQAQVAERLHTKQSAIARMEADLSGSVSLRRYVDFALACDMLPLDITLAPISAVRAYALANPKAPRTADAYHTWLTSSRQAIPAAQTPEAAGAALLTDPVASSGYPDRNRTAMNRELASLLQPNSPAPVVPDHRQGSVLTQEMAAGQPLAHQTVSVTRPVGLTNEQAGGIAA